MTIVGMWQRPDGVVLASDSRISFNGPKPPIDIFPKIHAIPVNLQSSQVKIQTVIGVATIGNALCASSVIGAMRNYFDDVLHAEGDMSVIGMPVIIHLTERLFRMAGDPVVHSLMERAPTELLILGHCADLGRPRAFLVDLLIRGTRAATKTREIRVSECARFFGASKACKAANRSRHMRTPFHQIKSTYAVSAKVGGPIQCGVLSEGRFRLKTVVSHAPIEGINGVRTEYSLGSFPVLVKANDGDDRFVRPSPGGVEDPFEQERDAEINNSISQLFSNASSK